MKLAQDAGFDNINLDLMYALPQQTLAMAERDLERAFALQPAHVSHYQLTLEPNTMFAARPPEGIPDDDASWDMQEHCQALLAAGRLRAVRGQRLRAAGPAMRAQPQLLALWRLPRHRRRRARQADARRRADGPASLEGQAPGGQYLAAAGHPGAIGGDERIEPARRPFEFMLNALRLVDGFDLDRVRSPHRPAPRGDRSRSCDRPPRRLAGAGRRGRVRPTELGRRFTNDVVSLFLDS